MLAPTLAAARCVVVMTKPARPQRVKTRLIGRLTAAQAADLHAALLADVIAELSTGGFELRVAWALEAGEKPPSLPPITARQHHRQAGADLGARLFHALRQAAADHALVAAVGSDHPELSAATVEQAFDRLDAGADVVLGPAVDGGYYLIALRRSAVRRELFRDVAWSTDSVLATTEANVRALGLASERLAPGHDVDDAAALDALIERLGRDPARCAHTRAQLIAWGELAG